MSSASPQVQIDPVVDGVAQDARTQWGYLITNALMFLMVCITALTMPPMQPTAQFHRAPLAPNLDPRGCSLVDRRDTAPFGFLGIPAMSNLAVAYCDAGGEAFDLLRLSAWSVHCFCTIYAMSIWGGMWNVYAALSLIAMAVMKAGAPLSGLLKLAWILGSELAG